MEVLPSKCEHKQASTSAAQAERQGQGEKEIDLLDIEERVGEEDSIQHAAVREPAEAPDKTLATSKSSRHRGTGFNPEWLNMPQFMSWLYDTQHGMFCRLCRQHKPAPKKGATKRAFVEIGALSYRKDYVERHITTEHHQESIRCQASLASGVSVMDSFEPTVVVEHEAIIGGFKCLYWLVKNEKAHHTNYPKLLSLAELLGCDYFKKLKIDQRNNYRSHRIIDEMLEILSQEIEEPILMAIRSSQAISLEIDESTDVSVSRQLDLHVRYMDKEGKTFNQFLDLVSVPDGKADTIVSAVKKVLLEKGIPTERLYGLGTDGAAVMTGRVNGVEKQLTDSFPKLVTVACAAHRLALACKDSSNNVKYMATFRDHLQDLYLYFRNSANRTATLKAASTTLGVSDLKLTEVKDTRWLSQHKAIETLQRNLSAVLGALAEEAEVRKCPGAKGLYTFCATYRFVAAVYLQADVLPHLACLSKNKNQEELLSLLASEFDEWANLYPCLSLLASIALVIPVSSVNCERDFSTMNRVKTDLRNKLQGEHLAACLRISINGACPEDFPYDRALESFFRKPRKIRFIVRINPDTPQVFCKFPDQQKKWEDGAKEKFWPEPSCVQGVRGFQLAKLLIHYGQFEFWLLQRKQQAEWERLQHQTANRQRLHQYTTQQTRHQSQHLCSPVMWDEVEKHLGATRKHSKFVCALM
ncbi:zinc finger protein 862-like [Labeo rohita]|uniref:Zinc finger protein 862-like n=1 Tax=Labeo rohita TaxID=84645 RepID=A0A498LYA8_LABRO|nr:zinc finger protein 862-like [Labeo rohita]